MANKYGVVRTDNVQATKTGAIKSARFYNGANLAPIENGNLVKLSGLISGERELWKAVAPGGVTEGDLYIVATPELIYDESLKSNGALNQFRNEEGENITLLKLEVGDLVGISDECIVASGEAPEVGSYVTPSATGTKWTEVSSIAKDEVFYGKIVAREIYKQGEYINVVHIESIR